MDSLRALYESMSTDELQRLQDAFKVDLAVATQPNTLAFAQGRFWQITDVLARRHGYSRAGYSRAGDTVTLRMSVGDYVLLTVYIDHASLAAEARGATGDFRQSIKLLNRLNAGNPNFTPYEFPETLDLLGAQRREAS